MAPTCAEQLHSFGKAQTCYDRVEDVGSRNSDEIKSLGLKKKSEYKRPTRKAKSVPLPKAA